MLTERWMYKDHWERIENEPDIEYMERKKILMNDWFGITRARGLPIVIRKGSAGNKIEIIYSMEHEFLDPRDCDVCQYTICLFEKKIHMVRVIDPHYPEGLLSHNTYGVLWKCKCVGRTKKTKQRFKLRSVSKESKPEESKLEIVSDRILDLIDNPNYKEPEEIKVPF